MTPRDFIAAIRARGLNQKEAAEALGVTEGAVSRWVNGNRPIPDIALVALRAIPLKRNKKPAA